MGSGANNQIGSPITVDVVGQHEPGEGRGAVSHRSSKGAVTMPSITLTIDPTPEQSDGRH
jgi:hypothetical protein